MPLAQQKARLPITKQKTTILFAVERFRTVVLLGETGSGKSTQVPQMLHHAGWTAKNYQIGVVLPRRVGAVSVASRIAEEMGVQVGDEVGYMIRFDRAVSAKTRITLMTDGMILREMLSDPLLTKYSVILVDDVHRRVLMARGGSVCSKLLLIHILSLYMGKLM